MRRKSYVRTYSEAYGEIIVENFPMLKQGVEDNQETSCVFKAAGA